MKKFLLVLMLTMQSIELLAETKTAASIYQEAVETDKKLYIAEWPFKFNKKETIYASKHIDMAQASDEDIKQRYMRMVHAALLGEKQVDVLLDRINTFSEHTPELIAYIESHFTKKQALSVAVKHISIYGSYLYNGEDPDDVDLLLIVDSPVAIFEHIEVPAEQIFEVAPGQSFPKVSYQVMDLNTYQNAQKPPKDASISRSEKMAQQGLTVAGAWYFTIYGFDLRYDNPKKLTKHMKINYLNKAFNTLNAAGSRLYKTVYKVIPEESERVRLRKVVSRILITDFIIPRLSPTLPTSLDEYEDLYADIREIDDADQSKWQDLEKRLEEIYLQKLQQLLSLAEKYSKIDQVEAK